MEIGGSEDKNKRHVSSLRNEVWIYRGNLKVQNRWSSAILPARDRKCGYEVGI